MNETLYTLVCESEGCKLKSYQDSGGVWTIGRGHTGKDVCARLTWSQDKADDQTMIDCTEAMKQALHASPVLENATPERVAAISDFVFNLGIGNYNRSTLKLRVDQANWSAAATEIKRWNKCNGLVLAGLTIRREKEAALLAH
jgi:lysozyme